MDMKKLECAAKRMCNAHEHCIGCPLEGEECILPGVPSQPDHYERAVELTLEWAAEHPEPEEGNA